MSESTEPGRFSSYLLLVTSSLTGLMLFLSTFFDQFTFGFGITTLGLYLLLPICILLLIVAIIYLTIKFKKGGVKAAVPLLITFVALILGVVNLSIVPRFELAFRWGLSVYQEVIALVEKGRFALDQDGFAELPSAYANLSDGGKIKIIPQNGRSTVLFFTGVGILGEYSGSFTGQIIPPPAD